MFKDLCVFVAGAAVGIGILYLVSYIDALEDQNERYRYFYKDFGSNEQH